MNKYIAGAVITLSLFIILFGKYQYDQKLSDISTDAQAAVSSVENVPADAEENEPAENENETEEAGDEHLEGEEEELERHFEHMPEPLADVIKPKLAENETISVLAFGSQSLTDSQDEGLNPWPELLEEELNDAFDTDVFSVETMSVGGMTSLEMIQQGVHRDVAEKQADLVIIEPLLWNDNGQVSIDHSTEHVSLLIQALKAENEQAVPMINPSQPAYNTVNYPIQIEGMRTYANENDYIYIDHWSDWPDITDEDLLNYVDEDDHRMPAQKGHEQWSKSILSVFTD
ncbi:SGNH/GDSL hydrolase family protein [Salipaludibacillus sp. CUR1]|uniref:SGNH/GDSL hydrolase family protein n=1 Tax=Salipaludibacillus sp. CUR1 TaxID=2820003 RepID=UPI001E301B18|nr:SGNH/GDSL hydrolase family protein [Salipaludibacillus sp. CUR1]MCE7791684.1 SGNH/GDSL hydrolase family protein [Salipaludibacillus sp. CUR1]